MSIKRRRFESFVDSLSLILVYNAISIISQLRKQMVKIILIFAFFCNYLRFWLAYLEIVAEFVLLEC